MKTAILIYLLVVLVFHFGRTMVSGYWRITEEKVLISDFIVALSALVMYTVGTLYL